MLFLKSSRLISSQYLLRAVSRFYVSQLAPNENNGESALRHPRVISIPDSDISTESPPFNRISLDNPEVAQQLVKSLSKHQKRNLLSALYECKSLAPNVETDLASIEPLFRRVDRSSPIGLLDRYEFVQALRVLKLRQEHDKFVKSRQPVGYERLITLSVATGIPYIAFGFLDNLIMVNSRCRLPPRRAVGADFGRRVYRAHVWVGVGIVDHGGCRYRQHCVRHSGSLFSRERRGREL